MNKKIFCERLTISIKNSGYTQKEIAKLLNISQGNLTNWKKGDNLPSIDVLYNLCIILQESADYLLGLEND